MWSNDLALIKDTLLIPIEKDRLSEFGQSTTLNGTAHSSSHSNGGTSSLDDVVIDTTGDVTNGNCLMTYIHCLSNAQFNIVSFFSQNQNSPDTLDNYLHKYDTFINESKIKLRSLETMPK